MLKTWLKPRYVIWTVPYASTAIGRRVTPPALVSQPEGPQILCKYDDIEHLPVSHPSYSVSDVLYSWVCAWSQTDPVGKAGCTRGRINKLYR